MHRPQRLAAAAAGLVLVAALISTASPAAAAAPPFETGRGPLRSTSDCESATVTAKKSAHDRLTVRTGYRVRFRVVEGSWRVHVVGLLRHTFVWSRPYSGASGRWSATARTTFSGPGIAFVTVDSWVAGSRGQFCHFSTGGTFG